MITCITFVQQCHVGRQLEVIHVPARVIVNFLSVFRILFEFIIRGSPSGRKHRVPRVACLVAYCGRANGKKR